MLTGTALGRVRTKLLTWYAESRRDLPWRRSRDPYHIWLSEIMLQQTRVAAVIPYYERFLEQFPDLISLSNAPPEDVLRLWSGLGYYSRARNLLKAAQWMARKRPVRFPDNYDEALALPGIGPYTAAAILSIAYGKQLAVLDGNVARVLARIEAFRGDIRKNGNWQRLQQHADRLLAPGAAGDWNQALMELGATVCTPREPQCSRCPLLTFCKARKRGLVESIPAKRKTRTPQKVRLGALVFVDRQGNSLLLAPPRSDLYPDSQAHLPALISRLWHFPTLELVKGTRAEIEKRARRSKLIRAGLRLRWQPLDAVRHRVTYREITLLPYLVRLPTLPRFRRAKIYPLACPAPVPISALTRKVAEAARQAFHGV